MTSFKLLAVKDRNLHHHATLAAQTAVSQIQSEIWPESATSLMTKTAWEHLKFAWILVKAEAQEALGVEIKQHVPQSKSRGKK